MIVLNFMARRELHIIDLYRPFNPPNFLPIELFRYQIETILKSYTDSTLLMGDFNLDWNNEGVHSYPLKKYFRTMNEVLKTKNVNQQLNFPTRSRVVNGVIKESNLYHIFTSSSTSFSKVSFNSL
jgi:endonuclease/exonuclease/phosphatase family metal-dependent hydrolase